ncbi:MAG: hypothetical protein ACOVSW_13000 [Candidatus Kapaibacteriota bacterium]
MHTQHPPDGSVLALLSRRTGRAFFTLVEYSTQKKPHDQALMRSWGFDFFESKPL